MREFAVEDFLDDLRGIDEMFGSTSGMLMAIPELPVRKSDKIIRNILSFLFHRFLLRIQNHLAEDYFLKEKIS